MAELDFDFYAGGIEDGMLQVLKDGMTGVRMFEKYSGQLDDPESLKAAIAAQARQFPLVMVSYADGEDIDMPPTSPVLGRSLHFHHECVFAVICVSTDARGDEARRRGTAGCYAMIAQARKLLTGLRLSKVVVETVEDEEVEVKYLLTVQVLKPLSNEYIARMPNMTAYAVPFTTTFKWSSPDRTVAGTAVTEVVVAAGALNSPSSLPDEAPGVKAEVEN